MAFIFSGPRHIRGFSLSATRRSIEMTFTPCGVVTGFMPVSVALGFPPLIPSILGIEGPCMSESRIPTFLSFKVRAVARLAVTMLFPTPPFPDIIMILCFTLDIFSLTFFFCAIFSIIGLIFSSITLVVWFSCSAN